jgi:hypothetical protein
MYTLYAEQFASSIATIKKVGGVTDVQLSIKRVLILFPLESQLSKNDKFCSFLENTRMDAKCAGLDLAAYLLTPIQRLPRYVLLLANLHKACSILSYTFLSFC